jgi:hypothetical protein
MGAESSQEDCTSPRGRGSAKLLGQLGATGIAPGGIHREGSIEDLAESRGQVCAIMGKFQPVSVGKILEKLVHGLGLDHSIARQGFKEDRPELKQVAPRTPLLPPDDLGRHVIGGPEKAGLGQQGVPLSSGQAQVHDHGLSPGPA